MPTGRRRLARTLLALLALFVAGGFLIRWAFLGPSAGGTRSGVAYGEVVALRDGGRLAVVRLDGGPRVEAQISRGPAGLPALAPHFAPGDRVQLDDYSAPGGRLTYGVADYQRGPALAWLLLLFIAIAAVVGRGKALRAVAGTAAGLAVVALAVVPAILRGADPVLAALAGSGGVLVLSMYFVHGFDWKTTAALFGTLAAVLAALLLGDVFLHLAHVTGFGTEDSLYLAAGTPAVDIQGLVLTAVVIGALGALVDITIGQASAVAELAHLGGPRLGLWALYDRAMNVGLDHIGSLVNTLVLAYVGSSLPVIVLLESEQAGWRQNINLELVAVALIQALVGAAALILAVPLTTFVAAALFHSGRLPRAAGGHGH